ncbi:MAG: fasciclin domain-containing protein [Thiohalocapsa sp.]|nr:fasciclin domain-containing protein [Thiohalocapsa sp.]
MEKQSLFKQQRLTIAILLVLALGPLAALTLGSKFADEETRERANAGAENMEPADRYGRYELPEVAGEAADSTVMDVTSSGVFDNFRRAAETVGMDDVLRESGPFTVFAPGDAAFDQVERRRLKQLLDDPAALSNLLGSHVAHGRYGATDLLQMDSIETLDGKQVRLGEKGHLSFGDAEIVKSNLVAGNGVVHVLGSVAF